MTILASAGLGLVVALSTFLVIGATSALTFNVLGHLKTAAIVVGGCLLFGDAMPWKKAAGLALALAGIAWYSHIMLTAQPPTVKESPLAGSGVKGWSQGLEVKGGDGPWSQT